MKAILIILSAWIIVTELSGQRNISLHLSQVSATSSTTCYNVSLSTEESSEILLAGQNYRFFYDADEIQFDQEQVESFLNPLGYSTPEIEHSVKGGIGFISISIDAFQFNESAVVIDEELKTTMSLCFQGKSKKDQDLIWADPSETNSFASAEIVITRWSNRGFQEALTIEELSENKHPIQNFDDNGAITLYPNPTDGILQYRLKNTLTESSNIVIQDVLGRSQTQKILPQGSNEGSIDISQLPDGTYYLKFQNSESIQVIKSK